MLGPGKYDDLCTQAREAAGAVFTLLVIGGGKKGTGFSVQVVEPGFTPDLPALLRAVADEIEEDQRRKA
jgi:hypothetical protein